MRTQLTIDFRAISHARYFYRNQYGETVRCKPRVPTVHGGATFAQDELICNSTETRLQFAQRTNMLDRWVPVCVLQLRNNHALTFVGKQATKKWKGYNEYIYSRS